MATSITGLWLLAKEEKEGRREIGWDGMGSSEWKKGIKRREGRQGKSPSEWNSDDGGSWQNSV